MTEKFCSSTVTLISWNQYIIVTKIQRAWVRRWWGGVQFIPATSSQVVGIPVAWGSQSMDSDRSSQDKSLVSRRLYMAETTSRGASPRLSSPTADTVEDCHSTRPATPAWATCCLPLSLTYSLTSLVPPSSTTKNQTTHPQNLVLFIFHVDIY